MTTTDPQQERPGDQPRTDAAVATAAPPPPPEVPASPPDAPEPPRESNRRFKTFDSLLDVPAFRWYLLSMSGNWSALQMQQVARDYLAFQVTGSFTAVGAVELANTWPRLFLALYGGVLADRAPRRVIIQVGQAVNAINAGTIAVLLFTGNLQFYHLIMVSFVQGILNSFVLPARQAMIPEIVGPNRLMNAYALNVFALNSMRLGAPAIAGGVIAYLMYQTSGNLFFAVGVVFAIMSLLNVMAVTAMFPVPKTDARTRAAARGDVPAPARRSGSDKMGFRDIKDAFVYLKTEPVIIWLMVIHSSTAMLSLPFQRLLSGFVDRVLSSSREETAILQGLLLAIMAAGALGGSLLIASLPDRRRGKILGAALGLLGVTYLAFAASTVFWLSAGIVLVLGVAISIRQSIANILIQARVQDAYRGRVSAIMLLDDGLESLGIFGIAMLADWVGPQWAMAFVGSVLLAYAGVIWSVKTIRNLD